MPRDPNAVSKGFAPEIDRYLFEQYEREGWSLEVECWSCKRVVYYGPDEVVSRFGATASTRTLSRRLVCGCGANYPAMRAVVR